MRLSAYIAGVSRNIPTISLFIVSKLTNNMTAMLHAFSNLLISKKLAIDCMFSCHVQLFSGLTMPSSPDGPSASVIHNR